MILALCNRYGRCTQCLHGGLVRGRATRWWASQTKPGLFCRIGRSLQERRPIEDAESAEAAWARTGKGGHGRELGADMLSGLRSVNFGSGVVHYDPLSLVTVWGRMDGLVKPHKQAEAAPRSKALTLTPFQMEEKFCETSVRID